MRVGTNLSDLTIASYVFFSPVLSTGLMDFYIRKFTTVLCQAPPHHVALDSLERDPRTTRGRSLIADAKRDQVLTELYFH
jgi:hypothetical protein